MQDANAENVLAAYWPASADHADYVTSYHRFNVAATQGNVVRDAFFPSWACFRFSLAAKGPWSMRIGSRSFAPVPAAAFVGPTGHATYCEGAGGVIVGLGLSPMGWARMFGGDISSHANRVIELSRLVHDAQDLQDELAETSHPPEVLGRWVAARLAERPEEDPVIGRIWHLLHDPQVHRIETIVEQLDIAPRALAAIVRTNFGFTPKVLLRRDRFLRALSTALMSPRPLSPDVLNAAGYWDRSHFLRDSHLFLGCSVRDFRARRGAINAAALFARQAAIGTPV